MRTATISLDLQEENLVRGGFVRGRYEEMLLSRILTKLRESLELSDILLRPVTSPRFDLNNLDIGDP